MSNRPIRVLIADYLPQARSALRLVLSQELGMTVVGEAGEAKQALELIDRLQPDLLLVDWELASQDNAPTLAELRAMRPSLVVVVLSGRPEARQAAIAAGCDAFVGKGDPPERLLQALRGVAAASQPCS